MRVDDVMKRAQGCREGTSVRECARIMKERNVGFLPVCDAGGKPIGTITDRDLAIRVLAEGRSIDSRIETVMTRDIVGCRLGDDLQDAERLMRERRKSRVVVCDQGGKLVGVISLSDIAEREDEQNAARTLRDVASRENQQPHAS
jgi:CBS domain-containing protein